MTSCPEIASQSDSDIELSTYERSNGTTVVIGCKGFGRHISGPPLVECQGNGIWSETPNLKCEFGLDLKEKVFIGAAAVSVVLVLITLLCICIHCCCCRRRRRRHYHHRYHDWRHSDDSWDDRGSGRRGRWWGWTSRWFSRSGDDKDVRSSYHDREHKSGLSKTFVKEYGYSRGDQDSFSKRSGFFRSSRRHSDDDKSVDRKMHSKKHSGKHSDTDDHSVYRQDFAKKPNFLRNSGKYSDVDKHSHDKLAVSKKSDFLKQSGKYSDMDRHSLHHQDFTKRSNFTRHSGGYLDRNKYPDDRLEGRHKGWRGWTDSLRENWIDWRSRTFGDSPADGSVRGHDHYYGGSYNDRDGFREKYGRFSHGNRADIMESMRQSNDDMSRNNDFRRGRRYSDSSLFARRRYARREASYGSKLEDDVHYNRVRRYSDPTIYRSEYNPYRYDVSRDSRLVSAEERPSFNIIRYDDSRHHLLERRPATFEYTSKPIVHYSGAETAERYMGPTQILEPLYYRDPYYYLAGSRNSGVVQTGNTYYGDGAIRYSSGTILDGQARYSGGTLIDDKKVNYVNTDGLLRLPPIPLDQLSKVVNVDLNGLNRSYSTRVVSSPRILELDGNKHLNSRIVENDLGRTATGHFEILTANPSAGVFEGTQEIPVDNSTRSGGHYTLYQGKGRTRQLLNF